MVWVIIGCTILIIVCLGGAKRLGLIILGMVVVLGALVFVFNNEGETSVHVGPVTIIGLGAAFALVHYKAHGV